MTATQHAANQGNEGSLIAVLGAGSWGTALAMQLMRAGSGVVLWDWDRAHIDAIAASHCNKKFLPDFPLPEGMLIEPELESAVRMADEILIVVPSHAFAGLIEQIRPWLKDGQGISWACKGLEPGTGRFLHEPAEALFGDERPLAVGTQRLGQGGSQLGDVDQLAARLARDDQQVGRRRQQRVVHRLNVVGHVGRGPLAAAAGRLQRWLP